MRAVCDVLSSQFTHNFFQTHLWIYFDLGRNERSNDARFKFVPDWIINKKQSEDAILIQQKSFSDRAK